MNDETTIQGSDITGENRGMGSVHEEAAFIASQPTQAQPITQGDSILGLYDVLTHPIEGGMGRVFKVRHGGWERDLAMKQPHARLFKTEDHKVAFTRECDAWINLGLHPHIVSCYYVRQVDGIPSIFSEWMEGGSLGNWMADGHLYGGAEVDQLERILDIAIQYARGLNFAHEKGLIHQDVKPDNVLLTADGTAKVADFGIAQARAGLKEVITDSLNDATGLTDPHAFESSVPVMTMMSASGAYTPAYCSIEQMNGLPLTRRTDIYSWAVTLLEMLLRDRPWPNGVVAGMGCEDYFGMIAYSFPESLKELLRECFREDESARPRDFTVIDERLVGIYAEVCGKPHERPRPRAAGDTADFLNNKALTYIDLQDPDRALECWEEALREVPTHLESTYNMSLHLWRTGKIDDLMVMRRVEACADAATWKGHYLMYLIQLERGAFREAKYYRRQLRKLDSDDAVSEKRLAALDEVFERIPSEYVIPERKASYVDLRDYWMGEPERFFMDHDLVLDLDDFHDEAVIDVGYYYSSDSSRFVVLGGNSQSGIKLFDPQRGRIVRSVMLDAGDGALGPLLSEDGRRIAVEFESGTLAIAALPTCDWFADWELCAVKQTDETLDDEINLANCLSEAQDHFSRFEIAKALAVLQDMRTMPAFKKTEEWVGLFSRVTRFCRKVGIHDLYRAQVLPTEVDFNYFVLDTQDTLFACENYTGEMKDGSAVYVLDKKTGEVIQKLPAACNAFALSSDGDQLAFFQEDGSMLVLNLFEGTGTAYDIGEAAKLFMDARKFPSPMAFHPDGKRLFMAGFFWDLQGSSVLPGYEFTEAMRFEDWHMLFSLDGTYAAFTDTSFPARSVVYDFEEARMLHEYTTKDGALPCFSPDGTYFALADEVCVDLYDPSRTGNFSGDPAVRIFAGAQHGGSVTYTADGNFIIAVHVTFSGVTVCVYDAHTHEMLKSSTVSQAFANGMFTLSGDGSFAISRDAGLNTLSRWEFDWIYEFPGWSAWDEGARPYLEAFIKVHPDWTDDLFEEKLLMELERRGFGWLESDGVREMLDDITL